MKPKLQQKPSGNISDDTKWRLNYDRGRGRQIGDAGKLPCITMKASEFWPVLTDVKPYAGPTLWTPWFPKEKHTQPFLTLTPAKQASNCTLPLVSLTPRQTDIPYCIPKSDTEPYAESKFHEKAGVSSTTSSVSLPPVHYRKCVYGLIDSNQSQQLSRRKKRTQSPLFPDVFKLTAAHWRPVKSKLVEIDTTDSITHKNRIRHIKNNTNGSKPQGSFTENENIHGILPRILSKPERNDQDEGTLFSRRHHVTYSRLMPDPTFLPISKNGVLRHQSPEDIIAQQSSSMANKMSPSSFSGASGKNAVISTTTSQNDNDDSNNKSNNNNIGPGFATRMVKHQRQTRRSYVRSHAHRISTVSKPSASSTLDCVGLGQQLPPATPSGKDLVSSSSYVGCNQLAPEPNDSMMRLSTKLPQNSQIAQARYQRHASSKLEAQLRVSTQFCDVLGQKTCRRCQEFYHKHFTQPPEENAPKVRIKTPPLPLTRESTSFSAIPTAGLQKIVIKVKDDSGKMAVAAVSVNPGLF